MNRQLELWLRPLRQRLSNLVTRAVVTLATDGAKLQRLQLGVLAGETIGDGEHHQPYGFTSVPFAGAEAVVLFPGGDRGRPLVVAVSDRRHRPTGGEPGEVTVYNHTGAKLTLTKDGDIVATPAAGREVKLGSSAASQVPALAAELADLKARIAAWAPAAGDGGASLKLVIADWSASGATKVKLE